jgi:hypothetical protein
MSSIPASIAETSVEVLMNSHSPYRADVKVVGGCSMSQPYIGTNDTVLCMLSAHMFVGGFEFVADKEVLRR